MPSSSSVPAWARVLLPITLLRGYVRPVLARGSLAFLLTADAERFSRFQLMGLVLGFLGVTSLVGLDLGHLSVLPIVEMLGVAVCYAADPLILTRWLADLSGTGVMSCALAASAVVFLPFGVVQWPSDAPADAWLSVMVLALVCTAVAFLFFVRLIAEIGPTRAMVITYSTRPSRSRSACSCSTSRSPPAMAVGFPLILVGCAIATGGRRAPVAEAELELV